MHATQFGAWNSAQQSVKAAYQRFAACVRAVRSSELHGWHAGSVGEAFACADSLTTVRIAVQMVRRENAAWRLRFLFLVCVCTRFQALHSLDPLQHDDIEAWLRDNSLSAHRQTTIAYLSQGAHTTRKRCREFLLVYLTRMRLGGRCGVGSARAADQGAAHIAILTQPGQCRCFAAGVDSAAVSSWRRASHNHAVDKCALGDHLATPMNDMVWSHVLACASLDRSCRRSKSAKLGCTVWPRRWTGLICPTAAVPTCSNKQSRFSCSPACVPARKVRGQHKVPPIRS